MISVISKRDTRAPYGGMAIPYTKLTNSIHVLIVTDHLQERITCKITEENAWGHRFVIDWIHYLLTLFLSFHVNVWYIHFTSVCCFCIFQNSIENKIEFPYSCFVIDPVVSSVVLQAAGQHHYYASYFKVHLQHPLGLFPLANWRLINVRSRKLKILFEEYLFWLNFLVLLYVLVKSIMGPACNFIVHMSINKCFFVVLVL